MTIHLVRHASAGRRNATGDDRSRPLDVIGVDQAKKIEAALNDEPIQQIVASPAVRCIETVQPLADALGVEVTVAEDLWEGQAVSGAIGLISRLAVGEVDAVLCSHGDMIPAILGELSSAGVPLDAHGCAKGSVWTLSTLNGRVSAARYRHRP